VENIPLLVKEEKQKGRDKKNLLVLSYALPKSSLDGCQKGTMGEGQREFFHYINFFI
jgi:hypothetical protein